MLDDTEEGPFRKIDFLKKDISSFEVFSEKIAQWKG